MSKGVWASLKHVKINHPRNGFEEEYQAVRAWCEKQPMEDIYIRSYDGLMLHAKLFRAEKTERYIILSHGYKGSSFGSVAHMAEFLHNENCSLLFIDQRSRGESEGKHITFGAKEQYDVIYWVRELHKLNKERLPVYLYGQSMGASTVLMAAGHRLPGEVKGIISDCGYHSMKQQFKDMAAEWFHIHHVSFLLFRVDFYCRLLAGFRMKDADTTEALKRNKRPVLFFHGAKDTYVYPRNTDINYDLCTAPKEKVIIPEARHLCSSYVDPELYKRKLLEFFSKYDK